MQSRVLKDILSAVVGRFHYLRCKRYYIEIKNALDLSFLRPRFKMFYKVFTKKSDEYNDYLIFAYFNIDDFNKIEVCDKDSKTIEEETIRRFEIALNCAIAKSIESTPHSFNYAQAVFSYPIYNQKLETMSGCFGSETESLEVVGRNAVHELCERILNDFSLEHEKAPWKRTMEYVKNFRNAIERAANYGQFFIHLRNNHDSVDNENYYLVRGDFRGKCMAVHENPKTGQIEILDSLNKELRISRDSQTKNVRHLYDECKDYFLHI